MSDAETKTASPSAAVAKRKASVATAKAANSSDPLAPSTSREIADREGSGKKTKKTKKAAFKLSQEQETSYQNNKVNCCFKVEPLHKKEAINKGAWYDTASHSAVFTEHISKKQFAAYCRKWGEPVKPPAIPDKKGRTNLTFLASPDQQHFITTHNGIYDSENKKARFPGELTKAAFFVVSNRLGAPVPKEDEDRICRAFNMNPEQRVYVILRGGTITTLNEPKKEIAYFPGEIPVAILKDLISKLGPPIPRLAFLTRFKQKEEVKKLGGIFNAPTGCSIFFGDQSPATLKSLEESFGPPVGSEALLQLKRQRDHTKPKARDNSVIKRYSAKASRALEDTNWNKTKRGLKG